MRKSRTTVAGLPDAAKPALADPAQHLQALERHQVVVPPYATVALVVARPDRGQISAAFFEDPAEFFVHYTKMLVFRRKPDAVIGCFNREPDSLVWAKHSPPTLIGVNLETRLR